MVTAGGVFPPLTRLPKWGAIVCFSICACSESNEQLDTPIVSNDSTVEAKASAATVDIRLILDTWRRRQESIRTVQFEVQEEQLLPKNSRLKGREKFPTADMTLTTTTHIYIDGDRWRVNRVGRSWSRKAQDVLQTTDVMVLPGETGFAFHGVEAGTDDAHNTGDIRERSRFNARFGMQKSFWPVFNQFRSTSDDLGEFSRYELVIRSQQEVVDGMEYLILERVRSEKQRNTYVRYWVDPARDFLMVRRQVGVGEEVVSRTDIEYEKDSEFGWIPKVWTDTMFRPSWSEGPKSGSITTCTVKNYRINTVVDSEVFRFSFPAGTDVTDLTDPEFDVVRYIVGANDEKNFISREDYPSSANSESLEDRFRRLKGLPNNHPATDDDEER